ncbi:MAG TPA: kelch repeat-containing protein [Gemmataceae bacterium]|nr:kelch repeat-containing protein [Gemmataceae bacterium]
MKIIGTMLAVLLMLLLPCPGSTLGQAQAASWSSGGSMHDPRVSPTATLLSDGKVLIAGGSAGENGNSLGLASAELYDPATGTWTLTGSMTTARVGHAATLLPSGQVLVSGGIDVGRQIKLESAELYDPTTGSWTVTGSLNVARNLHTATLLPGGKVLVAGGAGRDASAELYDPATGTWTLTGSMTNARVEHTATLLASGKVLVVGGSRLGSSAELAELYDPETETWSITDSNITARAGHTATLLSSGEVLVVGGINSSRNGAVSSAELYDPVNGWRLAGSMTDARFYHTATLLSSGEVLVAGGTDNFVIYSSAELYNPATGTWKSTASMLDVRWFHTASLLPDGRVLVTGNLGQGDPLASAELYTSWLPLFLHGSGGNANPNTLFLDDIAPTAATAKYKDSASVHFSGGNPWLTIGTWPAEPALTAGFLPTMSGLHAWVGLKNSDDIGTKFDLRAELSKNGILVASGAARCLTGITTNPALAKEVTVLLDPFPSVEFNGTTDTLSLKLLTRIGTNPDDTKCTGPGGSHNSAAGLRMYFDGASNPSQVGIVTP